MTVQELMDVMAFCDLLEVVVRKTGRGQWIQGYRIGNGQIDFKGVTCNYCEVSKRIYGNLRKEEDTPTRPEQCFMEMNTSDIEFSEVDLNEIPFA